MGCREVRPAVELLRVSAARSGELVIGRSLPGRGAWLCRASAVECARQATRRHRWSRALRQPVESAAAERLARLLEAGLPRSSPGQEGEPVQL